MQSHDPASSEALDVAREQLSRMRGMTGLYHKRFFADVRFTLLMLVGLFGFGAWAVSEAFLLVPFVALWGAVQTAFDASYLIMARHYARSLERWINRHVGDQVLVAAELEEVYLFPLDSPKVVTVPLRGPFTWFGFVTVFTTVAGLVAAVAGVWAGAETLGAWSSPARFAYLGTLLILAVSSLVVGAWWFVGGVGERRLAGPLQALDR